MSDDELWMQAQSALSRALPDVALCWTFKGARMYQVILRAKDSVHKALCALTELERRAAGVQPPKEG